jgi:L-cysteine:1D-myo-inositol 2-amino-2-deoxy-alpha-D-glucopyranoside ligase
LTSDLRTPEALDAIDNWCRTVGDDTSAPSTVADMADALLGCKLL